MKKEQIKKLQNKIRKADRKTKSTATRLINKFIVLNHEHALDTEEKYGMSYGYHNLCAIEVVKEKIKILQRTQAEIGYRGSAWYDIQDVMNEERKVLKHLKLMLELYKETFE